MSGRSQQDSTSRGDEIWSMPVHWVRFLWGRYVGRSHWRLIVAISMLWVVVLVHRDFAGDSRVVGMSMIVGRIIFSIVEGLGYVSGQNHGFVWRQLILLGPWLPRRLRM